MIGIVDVEVQCQNPNMPLYPMRAFVSSPTSIRVRKVPKRIGKWAIESVQFVAAYPDGSIKTAQCVLTGGVWVGTIEGTSTSGTSTNGYTIFAGGTDENGNAVTGYILGKGDIEILNADGTLNPDAPSFYVHYFETMPEQPHVGDSTFDGDTYYIYDGTQWKPCAVVETPSYIEDSDGNKIEADRDFTQVDIATSWVVDDGVSEHYLSGSKDNATERPPENPQDGAVMYYLGYGGMTPDMWSLTVFTYIASSGIWNMTMETSDASEEATELEFTGGITATWQKATTTTGKLATEQQVAQKQDQLSEAQMMAIDLDAEAIYTQVVVDSEWEPRKFLAASDTLKKQDFADAGLFDMTNNVWLHIPKGVQTGSNVTTIDTNLFNGCTQLQTFIGPNVKEVKSQAFNGCTALARVTIPNLARVGVSCFRDCTSLTSLVMPPSILFAGRNAFTGCAHVTVHFEEKSLAEVQGMGNYPWGLASNQITADKTATQNWVTSNYTNSSDLTSLLAAKRGVTDMAIRGLPEGVVGWFVVDGTKVVNIGPNQWNGGDFYISRRGENQYELEIEMETTSFVLDSSFTATADGHSIVGYANEIASQAWVEGHEYATRVWVYNQQYLSSVPNTYKTYAETVHSLSNDGYVTSSQLGNGTITLTQGGVTKGTFTTNQSANATIDLDAGGGGSSGYTVTIVHNSIYGDGGQGEVTVGGFSVVGEQNKLKVNNHDYPSPLVLHGIEYIDVPAQSTTGLVYFNGTEKNNQFVQLTGDTTVSLNYLYCIADGTLVPLANGTTKPIEDITYNDDLLVWDFDDGNTSSAKASWIKREDYIFYCWETKLASGKSIKTCGQHGHRFFDLGTNTWVYADEISGKTIYTLDGADEVVSSQRVEGKVYFYNIITKGHINHFGNGILLGCSLENYLYPVENMRFVKDNRALRPYSEFAGDVPEWWYNECRYAESNASKDYLVKYYKDRATAMKPRLANESED